MVDEQDTRSNRIPADWVGYLKSGWHGIDGVDWANRWLPARLKSELASFSALEAELPGFERAIARKRRDAIDGLIRFQWHLPWIRPGASPFAFQVDPPDGEALENDHPIPVVQLRNFVLNAVDAGDVEEATKRLQFSWLIPTVRVSESCHVNITSGEDRLCDNFRFPFGRYSRHRLKIFDDDEIIANQYSLDRLFEDLADVELLRSLVNDLRSCNFPASPDDTAYTKKGISRKKVRNKKQ